jgi:hypothetical protein
MGYGLGITGEGRHAATTEIVVRKRHFSHEFPPRQKPGSFSVDQAMQMQMNRKGDN